MTIEGPECDNTDFRAHACVLEHSCEYFRGLLADAKKKSGMFRFKLGGDSMIHKASFRIVLDFIYSGEPIICERYTMQVAQWTADDECFSDLEMDILKAADFLGHEDMVCAYTKLFRQRLTVECVVYKLGHICRIPGLMEARAAAVDYILEHIVELKVRCAGIVASVLRR